MVAFVATPIVLAGALSVTFPGVLNRVDGVDVTFSNAHCFASYESRERAGALVSPDLA